LGGGEKTHLGGVVVCEPKKVPIVIRLEGHYDNIVLKPIAEAASKKYNTKVAAIGGVHVDNASKDEIDKLVENCKELVKCI
jgi:phosphotransferase system IIB component